MRNKALVVVFIAIAQLLGAADGAAARAESCAYYTDAEKDSWLEALRRPRDTGSVEHRLLIDRIEAELRKIQETDPQILIDRQAQTFTRWIPEQPAIEDDEGRRLGTPWPLPYSGLTDGRGVSAELHYAGRWGKPCRLIFGRKRFKPAKHGGKIVVVQVKPLPMEWFLAMQARSSIPFWKYFHIGRYRRPVSLETQVPSLRQARLAGVEGLIVVLDMDPIGAANQYVPFTRPLAGIPAVYVDRETGSELIDMARRGERVTLRHEGRLQETETSHLLATLPATRETAECPHRPGAIVVNTHTDGPNLFEENGVVALWSLLRRFARLDCRPRDLVFVFATGHFCHEVGSTDDVIHRNPELFSRVRAALTIEHLGAVRQSSGRRKTEPGLFFRTAHDKPLNGVANKLLKNYMAQHRVLEPMFLIKPKYFLYGEGAHLEEAGIPTIAYLANPAYLLSKEDPEDWFDASLMCTQMGLFEELLNALTDLRPPPAR